MTPEDILDRMAMRAMTERQLVEMLTNSAVESHRTTRAAVAGRVAAMVDKYGGRIAGLSQRRLVSMVCKKIEKIEGKNRDARWAAFAAHLRQENGK